VPTVSPVAGSRESKVSGRVGADVVGDLVAVVLMGGVLLVVAPVTLLPSSDALGHASGWLAR
jgi:hypothetical protein